MRLVIKWRKQQQQQNSSMCSSMWLLPCPCCSSPLPIAPPPLCVAPPLSLLLLPLSLLTSWLQTDRPPFLHINSSARPELPVFPSTPCPTLMSPYLGFYHLGNNGITQPSPSPFNCHFQKRLGDKTHRKSFTRTDCRRQNNNKWKKTLKPS